MAPRRRGRRLPRHPARERRRHVARGRARLPARAPRRRRRSSSRSRWPRSRSSCPTSLYSGWVLSEPFAYPLALLAAWLGVRALDRPTAGAQLAFLGAAGLAGLARAQLLVLPLCFLAARRAHGHPRARSCSGRSGGSGSSSAPRRWRAPRSLAHGHASGSTATCSRASTWGRRASPHRVATQGARPALRRRAGGRPGRRARARRRLRAPAHARRARAGRVHRAVRRGAAPAGRRSGATRARCRSATSSTPSRCWRSASRVHAGRGWPWWRRYGLISAGLLVLAATVPLSGYAVALRQDHAPVLFALTRAEEVFGGVGSGVSSFVALVAGRCGRRRAPRTHALARPSRCTALAIAVAAPRPRCGHLVRPALRRAPSATTTCRADRSWVDHAARRRRCRSSTARDPEGGARAAVLEPLGEADPAAPRRAAARRATRPTSSRSRATARCSPAAGRSTSRCSSTAAPP